jgi:hypothetical protein
MPGKESNGSQSNNFHHLGFETLVCARQLVRTPTVQPNVIEEDSMKALGQANFIQDGI